MSSTVPTQTRYAITALLQDQFWKTPEGLELFRLYWEKAHTAMEAQGCDLATRKYTVTLGPETHTIQFIFEAMGPKTANETQTLLIEPSSLKISAEKGRMYITKTWGGKE